MKNQWFLWFTIERLRKGKVKQTDNKKGWICLKKGAIGVGKLGKVKQSWKLNLCCE